MRVRVPFGGYCPSHELRFAIVSRVSQYLITNEVPLQWDADIEKAFTWDRRLDADDFLKSQLGFSRYRHRVVEVREVRDAR